MKNGGWCWYQDPRAIIADSKLVIGGIDGRNGDVKVSIYDLAQNIDLGTVVLHSRFEADDHNAPALYARPDGSILAVYSKHALDHFHYYRISNPDNYLEWSEEKNYAHHYEGGWGITYMNLYYMQDENIQWKAITRHSQKRNIRPIFVEGDGYKVLIWLQGKYNTYTDYDCDAVGIVLSR